MSFWGFYTRYLRVGEIVRLLVRRARCLGCRCSHALLPDFVAMGRLDGQEVIGRAIEELAAGMGARSPTATGSTRPFAGAPSSCGSHLRTSP
jgi:hypothetical protein